MFGYIFRPIAGTITLVTSSTKQQVRSYWQRFPSNSRYDHIGNIFCPVAGTIILATSSAQLQVRTYRRHLPPNSRYDHTGNIFRPIASTIILATSSVQSLVRRLQWTCGVQLMRFPKGPNQPSDSVVRLGRN